MLEGIPILGQLADLEGLIQWGGLLLLVAIVFAETGLLFGFFLPGDSLLFTAGLLAAAGLFDVKILVISLILAAIIGDQVGYLTGKHIGRKLFQRQDSRFFKQEYVRKAEAFYDKHGVKTIILARFVPIIRTFAPIVAGIGNMNYRTFVTYNIIGGIAWVVSMVLSGYYLVQFVPGIKEYLHFVILGIIVLSLIPVANEWWKSRKAVA